MKCEVPSFVSDFVVVENWQDSKGNSYLPGDDYGKRPDIFRKTPSFRSMHAYSTLQNTTVVSLQSWSNFIRVASSMSSSWRGTRGFSSVWCRASLPILFKSRPGWLTMALYTNTIRICRKCRVIGKKTLNLRRNIPDFPRLSPEYRSLLSFLSIVPVVNQYYEAQVYDVFVIKGNTAVFKCQIPSFVSDHVDIISWQDTANNKFLPPVADYGISLAFTI